MELLLTNMTLISGVAATLFYLFSAWLAGRAMCTDYPLRKHLILGSGCMGVLLQLWALHHQIHDASGVDLSLFNTLALISWMMALLTLIFSMFRPVITLTTLAFPLAALSTLAALLIPLPYHPPLYMSHLAETHVVLSIFSYSLYFVAAGLAILLSLLNHRLKHRMQLTGLRLLPPVQSLETLLFETLLISWIMLTLAIVLGFFAVHNLVAEHLVHKTFFSILAWLIFTSLLVGRYRMGWRGPRAVRMTLIGFSLLLIGFLGSKAVLELVLHVN